MAQPGGVMVGGRPRRSGRAALALGAVLVLGVFGLLIARSLLGAAPDDAAAPEDTPTPQTTPTPAGDPAAVAEAFLTAWQDEDWDRLQELTADQSLDAGGEHERAHRTLRVEATRATADEPVLNEDGERARVPFTLTWDLGDLGEASFDGTLTVVVADGRWRVQWWYPTLHPDLTPERRLQRVREWPSRAPILDAAGEPLVESVDQVVVGVQPGRMVDGPEAVLDALDAHTDADLDAARATLERDDLDPNGFYPLVTLDAESFAEARDALVPVAGILTRRTQARTPEDPGPLRTLLGRLGEVTAELLDDLGPPYGPTDTVGRSGLERAFERQLAGTPEQEARIVEGANLVTTIAYEEGTAPEPLETTLDADVQAAAQAAIDGVDQAAIVVVDAPTGEVRAAAWSSDLPIALSGRYPPGSTFKIVDAAALFADGADLDQPMDCPPDVRIGGRDFTNAGDYGPGEVDLREAFARSCNTAFALEAERAGADMLAEAAGWFGFDVAYDAGLPAFGGRYPEPVDTAELAASAIGQGRVEASPLHMASVAAAARAGVWRAPHLVRGLDVPSAELPAGVTELLDEAMREVVVTGTGTAAHRDGEPPVAGKTGSAEFGDGDRTHAWFVGYRGDLAFAVLVEGGGAGGGVAGPIANRLLEALE